MFTLHATRKLLTRTKQQGTDPAQNTNTLGSWYANILDWRPQTAFFVNESTLLPVLVPLTPVKTLLPRFIEEFQVVCNRLQLPQEFIETEVAAMSENVWSTTANRSVIGTMTNMSRTFEYILDRQQNYTMTDLAVKQATLLTGPEYLKPIERIGDLLGIEISSYDTTTSPTSGFTFKISIRDIDPPIWREVSVPESSSLVEFHQILQAAFGWHNCHLFSFEIDGTDYGLDEDGMLDPDELAVTVGELFADSPKATYIYDYGDYWQHDIQVVKKNVLVNQAEIVQGERACPPEDCGGPWGYTNLLQALANKDHEQHDELTHWIGPDGYDPEYFDTRNFSRDLEAIRLGLPR